MAGHSKKMTANRNVKEAQFLIRMNDLLFVKGGDITCQWGGDKLYHLAHC